MIITPLGQLLIDLVKIQEDSKKTAPKISAAIRCALLKFDPDTEDLHALVRFKADNGQAN